ncbi:YkvA family protein [Parahaliea aestuarii]|uniref:DUF1232 domain-containing protein n=1 Tax=Parahaliea aestuarii TaxID=1852021 RepID=A0A5C9A048_9GAMM|nr:YkvA family protein [Parahaliea aestuarii]TXS93262.1 DUF1232 domain-containing protein [Parahaliea aestuarii]
MARRSTANADYHRAYSEESFWYKLRRFAFTAGRELSEKALMLYYAARRPETPTWARATIYGALGYFIAPLDAIIDITPGIGYTDDLGVLALAFITVARYIDDGVRSRARRRVDRLFGAAVLPPDGEPSVR